MNVKFSVITICKNEQDRIATTISSVLEQEFDNVQLIVKDGYSSDKTNTIVKEYAEKFDKNGKSLVHIIKNDSGIYSAMNQAMEYVDGDWTIFLNAGDKFYDNFVLKKISKLVSTASVMLYGLTDYQFSKNRHMILRGNIENIRENMPFCHQSTFFRTDILRSYKYDESFRIAGDYDLILRIFNDFESYITGIDVIVSCFDTNGFSSRNHYIKEKELIYLRQKNKLEEKPQFIKVHLMMAKLKDLVLLFFPELSDNASIHKSLRR